MNAEKERHYRELYKRLMEQWPDHEEISVDTPQGLTHVIRSGPEGAEPLVLLHGRNTPSVSWFKLVTHLHDRYQVFAIDTMGEPGLSQNNGVVLSDETDYLLWLDKTLDRLGLDRVHLAGHSFGGWVATHYAIEHPERLSRLTLIDPAQVFAAFSPVWILGCLPPYFVRTTGVIRRFFRWVAQGHPIHEDIMLLTILGMTSFRSYNGEALLRVSDSDLSRLRVPTLHLLADQSVVHGVARAKSRAERFAPWVRTQIIESSSHFAPLDQPEKVAAALREEIPD